MARSAHIALCQRPSPSTLRPLVPQPQPPHMLFPLECLCIHVPLANSYSYSKSQITEHLQEWDKQDHLTHPHTLPEL